MQPEKSPAASSRPASSRRKWLGCCEQFRLPTLLQRYPPRLVWAAFMLVNGFLTIGLLAVVAMMSGTPFVFPSLGPTAYLLFDQPMQPASSPRNTIFGHAVGIVCGFGSLWLFGLTHHPPASVEGGELARVFCSALALSSTGALMILLDISHPPAGATTLIIALGIITQPYQLLIVEGAVALLVFQALAINRLAGLDYPVWAVGPHLKANQEQAETVTNHPDV